MFYDKGRIQEIISLVPPSRYLFLLHDQEGRISDILSESSQNYFMAIRQLQEAGSLAPFFELSGLASIQGNKAFPEKSLSPLRSPTFALHTTLQRHTLVTRRIGKNLFLGRIALLEFQPMLASYSLYTHIFVDTEKDTLVGFTPQFHDLFRETFPDPERMLLMPASDFFTPSPAQFQKAMILHFDPLQTREFGLAYKKDFSREKPGPVEESLPVPLKIVQEGVVLEGMGHVHVFLTFLKEIDAEQYDFIASFTWKGLSAGEPFFLLGGRFLGEEALPDDKGYLAGRLNPEGEKPDRVVIKVSGFIAYHRMDQPEPSEERTILFCKIGHAIHLFEAGKRLAAYHDSDFPKLPKGLISIGVRKGESCLLKRVEIRVRKKTGNHASAGPVRQIIRLSGRHARYFTLDRFYNIPLSQPQFFQVAGYFLNDVTEMKDEIQDLSDKYETQKKREKELKNLLGRYRTGDRPLIGESPVMAVIRDTAKLAAGSDATVLIEGETGAGKEVLARSIHDQSPRREGPFVKVDCATVPATLIESRLFGHEKGAFTGATARSIGLLETADTGTVFLDEVGNLSLEVQTKLLQFLNDFTITRVGGTTPFRIDVRVLAASNVSLEGMVKAGRFREDLYYRIHVVYMKVPSLSERKEDIPALARHFLSLYAGEQGKAVPDFTDRAMEKLLSHSWPGNVRELSNVVQRAVIFCNEDKVDAPLISFLERALPAIDRKKRTRAPFFLEHTTVRAVTGALKKNHGRVEGAAKELGMARATLYKFLTENKVNPGRFRRGFGSG